MCVDSTACSDRLREQPRVPLEPVRELEAERRSARPHDERRAGAVLQGAQPGRQLLEGPPRSIVVLYGAPSPTRLAVPHSLTALIVDTAASHNSTNTHQSKDYCSVFWYSLLYL